jgi:VWFA-related protein
MRAIAALAVLASVTGASVWAQAPAPAPTQDQPEVSSQEAPITFSSRVNLISVPVVVRDKEGRAVGNLRQQDFRIFDKGKPQEITKFSMEKTERAAVAADTGATAPHPAAPATSSPAALPENYTAYLVDDVHLTSGDLLNTRQALHRHLDQALDPALNPLSRAAIFTTSGIALTDFTADRAKLHDAVDKIQPYTSGIDRQMGCPYISYFAADQLSNQKLYLDGRLFSDQQLYQVVMSGAEPLLTAVYNEAADCAGPCGGGIDQITGLPSCVVETLLKLRQATREALIYGDHETSLGLGALNDVVRKLSIMPGNRNLVLVSPGFLLTRDHRTPEYGILERAIRANVVINTIDMRGLFAIIPGGSADEPPVHSAIGTIAFEQSERDAATQAQDVLADLANGTGGTFFHNDNDLKGGLNILAARPEYVYILGFSPEDLKYDGAYHALKVTLKNPAGLTIEARRGYWAPAHAVDSTEAAAEEIQETVFSRDEVRAIPLEVQTEFFESGDAKYDLTITARLDAKALRFNKSGERNDDTLTLVAGLFDPNGNYVAGTQKIVRMHLLDKTLEAFESAGISLKEDFTVAPGRYLVRVVVRDAGGKTITARNAGVEIP